MVTPFVTRLILSFAMALPGALAVTSATAQDDVGVSSEGDTWPTRGWPMAPPQAHGIDPALLAGVDQRVPVETPLLSAILMVHGGDIVYENYENGQWPEVPILTWSVTKSVTSIAVGIAFQEGLLTSLDQTLGELIPDRIPANADPRVPAITLEHLLTSTTGWQWDGRINFTRHAETDDLDLMLARPMVCDPGLCFEYDSSNTNLLSYIIQVQSGETMADYLQPRLFDPLGIPRPQWITMLHGETRGAGGLYLTPRDMAKIGFLYLNGGEWDGRRIVSEEWVDISTTAHASGASSITGVNIGGGAYGYQWWISEVAGYASYYANGYGGQLIYVVPALDVVVVTAVAGTDVNEPWNQQPVIPLVQTLAAAAAP